MGTRWNQTKMIFATRQMIIQIISAAIIMYPCCQCKLLNLATFPNIHKSVRVRYTLWRYFFHRCKNGNEHQTNCSESDIKNKLFEGTCSEYSHARIKYVCLGNGRPLKYVYEYYILVSGRNIFLLIDK